jgi:hypothetical protein
MQLQVILHRLDVKRRHPSLVLHLEEQVHERLQRDRLPLPRWPMEDQAEFPRHADRVEAEHSTYQHLLHLVVQDDVVPVRLLHPVVETSAAAPEAAIIHQNCVLDGRVVGLSDGAEKRARGFGVREDRFVIPIY